MLVKFSWGLLALTVFDALLVWLTWRGYQAGRADQAHAAAPDQMLVLTAGSRQAETPAVLNTTAERASDRIA